MLSDLAFKIMPATALRVVSALVLALLCTAAPAPEQFHVSYTSNEGEMWVVWATVGTRNQPVPGAGCVYGPAWDPQQREAPAQLSTYIDGGCKFQTCVPWNGMVLRCAMHHAIVI